MNKKIAVKVDDLTVAYNYKPVLWDIDLEIPEGVLMAIVGPNGAGKSTMMKILTTYISTFEGNASQLLIRARFQLTWSFPESFDTNGETLFVPVLRVTDKPCNTGEETPCFTKVSGLGNNAWSLDNDFRFDTESGHIKAVELRDGTNHYNDEVEETLIGSG